MLARITPLLLLVLSYFNACHCAEDFAFPLEDLLNSNQPVSNGFEELVAVNSPTQEPSAAPTYSPDEYMSFTATLRLYDATSNVLDDVAASILTDSVASVTGVQSSDVTLESYIAVKITSSVGNQERKHSPIFRIRGSETKQVRAEASLQNTGSSLLNLFQFGVMQQGVSALSDTQYYKISAVMRVTAKLADYPAYNNDIDALYTALSTALTTAVSDNSLQTMIVSNSIAADSATFASISGVETVAVSTPVAEDPSSGDDHSAASFEPGEVAGMVIAVMVGLGIAVFIVYKFCCKRKTPRSDAYVVYEPIVPQAASSSPALRAGTPENVTTRSARQVTVNPYERGEAVAV